MVNYLNVSNRKINRRKVVSVDDPKTGIAIHVTVSKQGKNIKPFMV